VDLTQATGRAGNERVQIQAGGAWHRMLQQMQAGNE